MQGLSLREMRGAIEQGIAGAWAEFADLKKNRFDTHEVVFGDVYGTRDNWKNNYLYRMAGVVMGLSRGTRKRRRCTCYMPLIQTGVQLDGANQGPDCGLELDASARECLL